MRVSSLLLAGLLVPVMAQTPGPPANAPWYSADTIVNTASVTPDWFTPNAFVAIFGTNLAFTTRAISGSDTGSGMLPTILPGTNLRVTINGLAAYIYYVSPGMVNVLLPASLAAGPTNIQLTLDGIQGPSVAINLRDVAPVVVTSDGTAVFGVHADGTLISPAAPAWAGETIFLFASGLGPTNPPQAAGIIPPYASQLRDLAGFSIWVNGAPLDPGSIGYAGILPGSAGVYQVVVTLPVPLPPNPEIRMSAGTAMSPPQTILSTQ
jgi:uncharacterized protein (TIGR03437 family)